MKISIVTPVFNRQNCIAECIESVLSQKYKDVEHLVIDGKSTDGTTKILRKYKNQLAYYISEKDIGIYDALNKGINKATGDIIGILHSDDLFLNSETLSKIAEAFTFSGADIVYAKGIYVDQNNVLKVKRIYSSAPFKKNYLFYGWIPLHTTIFVKRKIYMQYGLYNPNYTIASDYDISIRWFQNDHIKKFFLNEWVVKMRLGGCSTTPKHQIEKSKQDLKIIKSYKLHGYFTLACKIARKIPQYLVPQIIKFQYK